MILDLNKKLTIFLMLFFVSCSKNEVINNVEEDVHDQLSTNVEITLTKKGNITAKIKSEILKKNNQSLQLELYDNVNVDLFDENFGHIFYTNKKFKNYHLKLDYRFYGEHVNSFTNENDAWNYKNSGVMLHSEHPNQMFLDQGFPVSIEGQFLGGSGVNDRPTLNMCSPGTEVDINGTQAMQHCVNSTSKTIHSEEWVSVEFLVYSDSIVHHIIDKDTVMSYSNIRYGGTYLSENFIDKVGDPLKEGYISLQSEGHPIEFKNIRVKELD